MHNLDRHYTVKIGTRISLRHSDDAERLILDTHCCILNDANSPCTSAISLWWFYILSCSKTTILIQCVTKQMEALQNRVAIDSSLIVMKLESKHKNGKQQKYVKHLSTVSLIISDIK